MGRGPKEVRGGGNGYRGSIEGRERPLRAVLVGGQRRVDALFKWPMPILLTITVESYL